MSKLLIVAIWFLSYSYYRAANLITDKYAYMDEQERLVLFQRRKNRHVLIRRAVIFLILVLDVLSSISQKKSGFYFIAKFNLDTDYDTFWYGASWAFFLIIEIIGFMCLALLFVALRKIVRHVNEQTKILNN